MSPETYKSAIYRGVGSVEVVDFPYPECGDDDVVIRNLMAGVCGSDIGAYLHGGDEHYIWKDHEFGHEMVSEVATIGKNVKGLKVGDRVFPNMEKTKRDFMRIATIGGFSEYIHVPQCELGYSLLMVPDDIPVKAAALIEPFVIGTRGARSLEPGPGKTATVFGAGVIGMSAAIMLKWYGCDKVMVVDISQKRLDIAAKFGFDTCNSKTEDLKEKALEVFGEFEEFGGGKSSACDLYLDAIGKQPGLDGFQLLGKRFAKLAIVGVYHEPGIINNMIGLCYSNWTISGCGSDMLEDIFPDIIEMMRSGKYDVPALVSHVYKIDDIVDALKMAGNSEEALKVVIGYE